MDAVTLGVTLGKLVSAGMALNRAYVSNGSAEADLNALKSIVESGTGIFGLWRKKDDWRPAALHLALTSFCFGAAVARHWAGSTAMVPGKTSLPDWLEQWRARDEHVRRKEIETRTRHAQLEMLNPGDAQVSDTELKLLAGLSGSPLNNPLYQSLWKAFSDPSLAEEGEPTPLLLKDGDAREFERNRSAGDVSPWRMAAAILGA